MFQPGAVARWTFVNYREAYGMHASNGILFNHESPLRGETFVTRKIRRTAAAIKLGRQVRLWLGNLDARRNWGHAREYMRGMGLMMQQDGPDDYVLVTGESTTVRTFLEWAGDAAEGRDLCARFEPCLVQVGPRYFRPAQADLLAGHSTNARRKLGRRHETSMCGLAHEMVPDLALTRVAPMSKEA